MRVVLAIAVLLVVVSLWADYQATMTRAALDEPEVWHTTWGTMEWLEIDALVHDSPGHTAATSRSVHVNPGALAADVLLTVLGMFVMVKLTSRPPGRARSAAQPG